MGQNEPSIKTWTGNNTRNWFNRLVQFRIIGYVENKDNIKDKIKKQGFTAIMVGHAASSATLTYIK